MKNDGKGNRKAQKKRRHERLKNRPERLEEEYLLLDGNYSHYPVAYCRRKKAYLTQGLTDTHRCFERECMHLERLNEG